MNAFRSHGRGTLVLKGTFAGIHIERASGTHDPTRLADLVAMCRMLVDTGRLDLLEQLAAELRCDLQVLVQERFWAKVRKDGSGGCWLWTAATNGRPCYGILGGGLGREIYASRTWILAHRYAYQLLVGPIPPDLQLDHRCRTRLCVNPAHLRIVTHRENTLASDGPSARQARRNHCVRGHPFDTVDRSGKRRCSICDREKEQRRYVR